MEKQLPATTLVQALGFLIVGVVFAAAGICIGERDNAPGTALLGLLLAAGAIALCIRAARRKTPSPTKLVYGLAILAVAFLAIRILHYHSFPLQDGYRLQGRLGSHGQVYRGYFTQVIEGEVMGVQGSKTAGIIFGWVGGEPNRYFILHTRSGKVEWLSYPEQAQKLVAYGCPQADMNKEVNLAGLRVNFRKFTRD